MQTILLVVQVLLSISLIGLILIQHGKGADAGAAFGSGASSTVFGSSGSVSFLSRTTAILATLFFAVSLSLTVISHRQSQEQGLIEKYTKEQEASQAAPAQMPATDVPMVKETPKTDVPAVTAPATEVPASAPAAMDKMEAAKPAAPASSEKAK